MEARPIFLFSKKSGAQKGFSLIEVLIAIAILSFIVIGIASITGSSQDKAIDTVNEDRQILQVETAMSRIEWDVSQTYSPLYFDHAMEPADLDETAGQIYNQMVERYTVNPRFAFPSYFGLPVPTYKSPEDNTLTFFATANRRKFKNAKQSHFAWIQYSLVDPSEVAGFGNDDEAGEDEEEKGFVLTRKFMPDNVFQPEEIQWDKIKSQVLLRNVEELVFEFWNEETKKWTDNIATIKQGLHLVRGIKINLKWIDPDGIERTFIRVFRPLFPSFEPENMYKLIKEARAANTRNNQNPNQPGGSGADPGSQNPGGQGGGGAQGGGGGFQ